MDTATAPRAAIYTRISSDTEGLAKGVGRQKEDCLALADREGYQVVDVWEENDKGASTRSRKPRPKYAAMMEAAGHGEYDVILAYSNSRLTRRPMELEGIIQLHERTGVRVVTCVSGRDDLSTADGRMVARLKASIDAAEAERVAERVARVHKANRLLGRPVGGTRPFGWEADKLTINPVEADALLEAAEALIEGRSLGAVAARLNELGLPTTRGNQWIGKTVRQALLNPRLAGWRMHGPKNIAVDDEGNQIRGIWEPIMDQTMFDRLQIALKRPDGRRRIPQRSNRKYLLTGVLRCGICRRPLYAGVRKGNYYYSCTESRAAGDLHACSVMGPAVEKVIEAAVLARMAGADLEKPETPFFDQKRIDEVDQLIAEAYDRMRARGNKVDTARMWKHIDQLEDEKATLEEERAKWMTASVGAATTGRVTPEEWKGWTTDKKRTHIEKLLTAVALAPGLGRGRRKFDPSRLTYVWREDD